MTRKTLTEELPSSGNKGHTHDWQKIDEKNGEITLVCRCEGCNETKVVKKPVLKESGKSKKLLLG